MPRILTPITAESHPLTFKKREERRKVNADRAGLCVACLIFAPCFGLMLGLGIFYIFGAH